MNIKYFILTIIILITGSKLAGYNITALNTNNETAIKITQNRNSEHADSISDWQQFKIDAKVKINANEKRIAEFNADLKTSMKSDSKEVKADYKKEVARLKKQNNELKYKLNKFKYEGKEKWIEFKDGFNHDMDAVGNSINNLFSKKQG
jgi:exonuclease VII large subunit